LIRLLPKAGWRVVLLTAVVCLASGCTAHRALEHTYSSGPAWPTEEPRVRLSSTIDLDGSLERGVFKALHRLGDEPPSARFRRPYAVAWAGDDLIVVDPDARRVARIDPRGRMTFTPGGLFATPVGVASCPAGVVVTDSVSGRVALLKDGMRLERWLAEDLKRPTGIACSEEDFLVVETGRHQIVKLTSGGDRTVFGGRGSGPGFFNFPTSIATHDQEFLVGDALNFRIQRFDSDSGDYRGEFGGLGDAPGEMPRIKGVAVDPLGQVWVTDGHLDRVSLYDYDGNLLISIGQTGSFPGEFSFPTGIAIHPDGRVAVVDSLNRRLQVFRLADAPPTRGAR
jgi:hypothetical protein